MPKSESELETELEQAIEQLRHEYRTYEPTLDELRAFADSSLTDAEMLKRIEGCLALRADLRQLVHYMRHPDAALNSAADRALKKALEVFKGAPPSGKTR